MIYGKVGRLGHGKTMRATVDALALVELRSRNRECWLASNVHVRVPDGRQFFHLPMDTFSESLAALMGRARAAGAGLVVLVDEVDEVWGSTDWQNVRKGDKHRIKQSRHYGTDMIVTAQFVSQIEKSLRNIMEEVELLRAWPSPSLARRESGVKCDRTGCRKPWCRHGRPMLIRGQLFRPGAVEDLTSEPEKDKRLGAAWHVYRRAHESLYDTDQLIEPVNAEALCAKHQRELREDRCPRCHPETNGVLQDAWPLRELVTVAAATPAPDDPEAV